MRTKTVVFLLLLVLLAGCAHQDHKKTVIAMVTMDTTAVFWQFVHAGGATAAREEGVELKCQSSNKGGDDREGQINVVENMIVNSNAIVLTPIDDHALWRSVVDAHNLHIPVVLVDSPVVDTEDIRATFIATDNVEAGGALAEYLAKKLGYKGNVAVLQGVVGRASTDKRELGFFNVMKKYPAIKIVATQRGGTNSEKATAAAENVIASQKHGGELKLDAIFASMEITTFGAMRALEDQQLTGKVLLVGFDFSDPINDGIANGHITAILAQDPFQMGYQGVKAAVAALKGEKLAPWVPVPPTIVDKDNLHKRKVWNQLHPDMSVIGK